MKHIPYDYKIVNGKVEVDEEKSTQVKMLFTRFLEGESLVTASQSCSLNFTHSQVGRMLEKKAYCDDEFYPSIIPTEMLCLVLLIAENVLRFIADYIGIIEERSPLFGDVTADWLSRYRSTIITSLSSLNLELK